MAILFGGRIAEEMIFGKDKVTTGASNDIQVATSMARKMVTEWGMSDKLGPIAYEEPEGEVFLGYSISKRKNMADSTALEVDKEIRRVIDEAYKKAQMLLKKYKKQLDILAHGLVEYETLTSDEIHKLLEGKKIRTTEKSKKKIKPRATVPTVEGDEALV